MNALIYSEIENRQFHAMANEMGYTPLSTFYSDLSIAEYFGTDSLADTFNNICKSWLSDYKMFTEFILCLNWKIWKFYEENNDLAEYYNDLWIKAETIYLEHYEGNEEALQYYYRTTD